MKQGFEGGSPRKKPEKLDISEYEHAAAVLKARNDSLPKVAANDNEEIANDNEPLLEGSERYGSDELGPTIKKIRGQGG